LPAHFKTHSTNLKTRRSRNAQNNTLLLKVHKDYPCKIVSAETSRLRYEPIEKLHLVETKDENGHRIFTPKFSPKEVGSNYSIFWLPPSDEALKRVYTLSKLGRVRF